MSVAFKTITGSAKRVLTWAGEHHTGAAAVVILGAVMAAVVIIVTAPTQPGSAERPNHYQLGGIAAIDPARPPYPVRAPLPLPLGYNGIYEPTKAGLYVPSGSHVRTADKPPTIAVTYSGWYQGFKTAFARGARKAGAVPLVQIEPGGVSLSAIARGSYDSYLRAYADAVAAYQSAVIIGFGPEMNEHRYHWGYLETSPTVFIRAWQRIINVFRSQNADNVTWIWIVGKSNATARPLLSWWPGARYVTWVGIDGYYEPPARAHTSPFALTIARVRRITGIPVLLFGDGA